MSTAAGPPAAAIDPALERKLAAGMHLAGLVATVLSPLFATLVWGRYASPWFRRHLRDAFVHWAITIGLFVAAVALDTMNPVYDFGTVRVAALSYRGFTTLYSLFAWPTSAVFAVLSARRALRGEGSLYPFTMWWSAPRKANPAETMEMEER